MTCCLHQAPGSCQPLLEMFRSDGVHLTLLTHLSVLLQRDGTIVVSVVHVEED